ncbi:hypothetical protein THAOC_14834 [Thalassiosira oceanica]|uniref:Chromatin target of PRMT1 protein C-terminal domain-containing protein n=1 Tax=Thalassiosira oceanica TaxID=159749 RepID=K0SHG7_THAOC|nr:hypothetical protein THAOC_14834 [Thalassiosira oceanica]|eukprot:EJK64429.1 hypothetical protein THAOC_14834 [Thalassiosira oceanica]
MHLVNSKPGYKRGGNKNSPNKRSQSGQAGGGRRRYSGGRGGRGRRNSGGGKSRDESKPKTAEELEAEMDEYWMKSGNKELANKKLDEDMDSYWAKKEEKGDAAEDAEGGAGEASTEEAKPAASEETAAS